MPTKTKTTKKKPITKKTAKKSNKSLKKGLVFDKWVVLVIIVLVATFGSFFAYRAFAVGHSNGKSYIAAQMIGGQNQGSNGKGGPAEKKIPPSVSVDVPIENGLWNVCFNGRGYHDVQVIAHDYRTGKRYGMRTYPNGNWSRVFGGTLFPSFWRLEFHSDNATVRQIALTSNGLCPDGSPAKL